MKKTLTLIILAYFFVVGTAMAADMYWTGDAAVVAQVDTFTPANVEVGDIFTLTVTGLDGTSATVNFTATAATVANVTAGIVTAWNASTEALCTPVTAADANSLNVTLTADTAGDAFSVASTEADGGGTDDQTFIRAATTASAGPKHWGNVDNWSGDGDLPGADAGDVVYIENSAVEILYDLDQSAIANALASLNIEKTFTGKIGVNGATGNAGTYLQIKASVVNIGYNYSGTSATGSGRLMIDTGSTASTVTVDATATSSADTGKPSCRLLANNAATDIIVNQGKVGIAYESGETSTIDDLTIGYTASSSSDVAVTVGDGLTVDDISKRVGTLTMRSGCDVLTNESGAVYLYGTGAVVTLTINSGTVYSETTGTITTANADGGTLDLTTSLSPRTITNMNIGDGGSLRYNPSIITLTSGMVVLESGGKFLITSQEF